LRNKRRSLLTILSLAASLFLLTTLRTVLFELQTASMAPAQELRLITRHAYSFVNPMPMAYLERVRSVPGVREVMPGNWFSGIYIDESNFFGQWTVDQEKLFTINPELQVPDDQKTAERLTMQARAHAAITTMMPHALGLIDDRLGCLQYQLGDFPHGVPEDLVGDSLTERGEWWELLERPVANRGVAGDTVAAVRARLDDVAALDPRIVFVLVGINDLLAGASPEALAARHASLIAELRGRLPRARIVAESLLPIRDELVARDAELTSATVRRANELCRRGAAAAGADWLDLHARLADPEGELDPRYSSDGLHLSGAGYRAWAAAVLPYLQAQDGSGSNLSRRAGL